MAFPVTYSHPYLLSRYWYVRQLFVITVKKVLVITYSRSVHVVVCFKTTGSCKKHLASSWLFPAAIFSRAL